MNKRMKVILCVSLVVAIIAVAVLLILKYIDEKRYVADARAYVVRGNVIELKEDNYMILELIKADVGFEVGEKVLVKYGEVHYEKEVGGYIVVEPQVGDAIAVQYFENHTYDGYKLIQAHTVYKY